MASPSSSSSLSSRNPTKNLIKSIILHPNITLPSIIPPKISHKLTNFAAFHHLQNPFSKIPSPSLIFTKTLLLSSPIPLNIAEIDENSSDRDDLPIADLIPRKSRSQPQRKPISISVDTIVPWKPSPTVAALRTPHTRGKKKCENASLTEALQESKKKWRQLSRGRVISGFGGADMQTLIRKLEFQGWSLLFLQGDIQRKFGKPKVYEFYTNRMGIGEFFSTTMRKVTVNLYIDDIARILHIPSGGWGHYIKGSWLALDNLTSALEICRKFSGNPHLVHHRKVFKKEMSPLHQLYFDVVHKMIIPRKERRNMASFLDLFLMELLDTEVRIYLPRLILKHMQRVLIKEKNGHALPYEFWLTPILEEFRVPIQVWSSQTVKDIIGSVNHMMLPGSMKNVDNPMQRLRNALADKQGEVEPAQAALEAAQATYEEERGILQAQIASLTSLLERKRAENVDVIRKITSLIPSSSSL
ncbi:hypothetical protein P3L10_033689 [Capsicum annuum]